MEYECKWIRIKKNSQKRWRVAKNLVVVRKKRDSVADKLQRVFKKKNKTKSDLQRVSRYNESLIRYEKEMTKLIAEIKKNISSMEVYKVKVTKEQDKQFQSLTKTLANQKNDNQGYIKNIRSFLTN